jgi:hypothetical protein
MKNLLIYIGKRKCFDAESEILIKIQIDNSLSLGWKREDILLYTNFPYEYNGVKAIEVGDETFCRFVRQASKINVILEMFDRGEIGKELYWFHDLDVFQQEPLNIDVDKDKIALCDHGVYEKWNTGSIFFRNGSRDIFQRIKDITYKYRTDEERALFSLTGHRVRLLSLHSVGGKIPASNELTDRVKKINITHNFTPANFKENLKIVDYPIKVVHFHPIKVKRWSTNNNMELFSPILTDNLKLILKNNINESQTPERLR